MIRNIFAALVKATENGHYEVKYVQFESYTHLDVENMSNERKLDFFKSHWEENPDHTTIASLDGVDKFMAKYQLLCDLQNKVTMTTLH